MDITETAKIVEVLDTKGYIKDSFLLYFNLIWLIKINFAVFVVSAGYAGKDVKASRTVWN
jgi:hypothetical protein